MTARRRGGGRSEGRRGDLMGRGEMDALFSLSSLSRRQLKLFVA